MAKEIDPEKLLDMIRSILPSTARHSARHAKNWNTRNVRRRVRMALHAEDAEETSFDLEEEAWQMPAVWMRRGADKLNHFMRWCESWTEGMTDRQKLDAVRAVLPRDVIGDHAYDHWKSHVKRRRYRYRRGDYDRKRQSRYDKTRHRLRQAMSVDPTFQGRFNAAVKEKKLEGEPRRMLQGMHDIDDFVRAVQDDRDFSLEEHVLLDLLSEVEQSSRSLGFARDDSALHALSKSARRLLRYQPHETGRRTAAVDSARCSHRPLRVWRQHRPCAPRAIVLRR